MFEKNYYYGVLTQIFIGFGLTARKTVIKTISSISIFVFVWMSLLFYEPNPT